MLNAALSLFSEILALPFCTLIVLLCITSIKELAAEESSTKAAKEGLKLGIIFLLATLVKGIFEFIFIFYILLFVFLAILFYLKKKTLIGKNITIFTIVFICVFQMGLHSFKFTNKLNNGKYVLTNRGAQLFFGNAVKRTQDISLRLWGANILSIPGDNVCKMFFSKRRVLFLPFSSCREKTKLKR